MTEVLLVVSAVAMVRSILLPSASFSSMPKSSMKAPRVPEPSSRGDDRDFVVRLSAAGEQYRDHQERQQRAKRLSDRFLGNRSPFFSIGLFVDAYQYSGPVKPVTGFSLNLCKTERVRRRRNFQLYVSFSKGYGIIKETSPIGVAPENERRPRKISKQNWRSRFRPARKNLRFTETRALQADALPKRRISERHTLLPESEQNTRNTHCMAMETEVSIWQTEIQAIKIRRAAQVW